MSMEKDKRRAARRSKEAKALQQKQYRHRVIKNKKKGYDDDKIQISTRTVHQFLERDDIQGEVLPYRGRDLGDTGEDTSS